MIAHQGGMSCEELMSYRPAIYRNVLLSAQSIIETMHAIGVDFQQPENKVSSTLILSHLCSRFVHCKDNAKTVMAYQVEDISKFALPDLVARAINSLWWDPIVSTIMDHNNAFRLPDNAA